MRTPRDDQKGYLFIVETFVQSGKGPTYQAIADHMKYVSKRSASLMIRRLVERGLINSQAGVLTLTGAKILPDVERTAVALAAFRSEVNQLRITLEEEAFNRLR